MKPTDAEREAFEKMCKREGIEQTKDRFQIWLSGYRVTHKTAPVVDASWPSPVKFSDHPEIPSLKWSDLEMGWIDDRDQQWRSAVSAARQSGINEGLRMAAEKCAERAAETAAAPQWRGAWECCQRVIERMIKE